MNKINKLLLFVAVIFFASSCISNKRVIYMQDIPDQELLVVSSDLIPPKFEEYLLQANDVVDVTIRTSDMQLNQLFDINSSSGVGMMRGGGGLMSGGDIFYLTGYTLNDDGIVELPVIGELNLVGLNLIQAKAVIENELKKYVRDDEYFVRLRLGGIRYSALGEFSRPGKYTILQNRVTMFEAIANAGDLTILAKRDNILLIRQYPEGSRSYRVNLNHKDIMNSEFYYLRPNDMIYAEPMKVRELGTGTTFLQTLQLLTALATLGLLVYTTTN
jgi:polysaccharide export outer membrane protein